MGGEEHVARMGEIRNVHKILVGKLEGKGLLGRPSRRWEDNIRTDLREIGCEGMHLRFQQKSRNFLTS
jgi:hypothetical protein